MVFCIKCSLGLLEGLDDKIFVEKSVIVSRRNRPKTEY